MYSFGIILVLYHGAMHTRVYINENIISPKYIKSFFFTLDQYRA